MTVLCETCGKESSFKCPTCTKLKLKDSFFCSQDCFKQSWSQHRQKHVTKYDPFPNYAYTGKLSAVYPLSAPRAVPSHIKKPDYAVDGIPKSEMALKGSTKIEVLSPMEIERVKASCKIGRQVLEEAKKVCKVGTTTDEIDRVVHDACLERNAYPSPLNYHNFPKSCCTSVNEIICHGIPDQYELQDGDICNVDISVYYDGFHGDLNETYLIGNVDDASRILVDTTRECLEKAIEIVKPGMLYRDIGSVIQKHAQSQKLSVVKTYCGHGIHRYFHCPPNVPHYAKNKAVGVMKPGHVFTIEPMISQGTWSDVLWPDNWTAATEDGKRSAQFEHTLLVTEIGCEILTQ